MANNKFHKLEDMWDVVRWTPREESKFLKMLIDSSHNGDLFVVGRQRAVLAELAEKLTVKIGKHFSYCKKVLNKFKRLRFRYNLWGSIQLWDGVRLNATTKRFEASDAVWEAILQEHPFARIYRNESEKYWVELHLIFAGKFLNEVDDVNICPIQQLSQQNTVVVISDNEDEQVDEPVGGAQNFVAANDDVIQIEDSEKDTSTSIGIDGEASRCSTAFSSNAVYNFR